MEGWEVKNKTPRAREAMRATSKGQESLNSQAVSLLQIPDCTSVWAFISVMRATYHPPLPLIKNYFNKVHSLFARRMDQNQYLNLDSRTL